MKGTHQIYLFIVTLLAAAVFFAQRSCSRNPVLFPVSLDIWALPEAHHFGEALYGGDSLNFGRLQTEFAPFLESRPERAFWAAERENPVLQDHYANVARLFDTPVLTEQCAAIAANAEHLLDLPAPAHLYYYISGIDLETPCLYVPLDEDSAIAFVGLDNFLGANFPGYGALPNYQRSQMREDQLLPSFARALVDAVFWPNPQDATVLGSALYYGKRGLAVHALVPDIPAYTALGFTKAEWDTFESDAKSIWEFFVREQLLFNSDPLMRQRLVEPAPFSKLGTAQDAQIPGRVGVYLGYKIAEAYARKQKPASLQEFLNVRDAQQMLRLSNYKP